MYFFPTLHRRQDTGWRRKCFIHRSCYKTRFNWKDTFRLLKYVPHTFSDISLPLPYLLTTLPEICIGVSPGKLCSDQYKVSRLIFYLGKSMCTGTSRNSSDSGSSVLCLTLNWNKDNQTPASLVATPLQLAGFPSNISEACSSLAHLTANQARAGVWFPFRKQAT